MKDRYLLIISLFIAFVLWLYVFTGENRDIVLTLPVDVFDEPEGYIATISPNEVTVILSGPRVFKNNAKNVKAVLSLKDIPLGKTYVDLNTKNIKSAGFEIVSISPELIEVNMVKTVKRNKPVESVLVGEIERGYIIDSIAITPPRVEVEGDSVELALINSIKTEDILLDSVVSGEGLNVNLTYSYGIKSIRPDKVKVLINLKENIVSEKIDSVPVCISGTYSDIEMPSVSVTLKGRIDLLEQVKKSQLTEIDCSNFSENNTRVSVLPVSFPVNVTITSIKPTHISLGN